MRLKIHTDISSSSSSRLPARPSVGISPSDRQNSDVELSSMDEPYCAGSSTSSGRAMTMSRSFCRRTDLLWLSRRALLSASSSSSAAVSSSTTTPVRSSSGPTTSSETHNVTAWFFSVQRHFQHILYLQIISIVIFFSYVCHEP